MFVTIFLITVIKRKDCFIKRVAKEFVGDSMIKNITGTGISRENVIKMRPHPGATTIDIWIILNQNFVKNLM